ncbi:MAG TPA: NosD domain-containing protein [Dehalococcoidia bacterium]|nr:NosD domain-containing protein [Dehalococcoidia bacterium]
MPLHAGLKLPARLLQGVTALAFLAGAAFSAAVPAGASPAASPLCVNPGGSGGCSASINAAIAAASPGAVITIQPGTYAENVVVNKAVTLQGNGSPVVVPAVSNPTCGNPNDPSSICAGASIVIFVQADNVTIDGLTVDGDNPALSDGVNVGGANVDARDGIEADPTVTYHNLIVRNTTVRNVFLRGIQFQVLNFLVENDTIRNVQGNPNFAVGVLARFSSGTMRGNTVSDSSDALNSNWSFGIQFLNNTITRSGSGVHTDNAGGGGPSVADLIQDNTVKDCTPGGYGVWSFVSYVAPVFENNTVGNCDIGLAAYGTQQPVTPAFYDNTVNGSGAANTVGALLTTDTLGFGDLPLSAFLAGNTIARVGTGVHLQLTAGSGHPLTALLDGNRISASGTGIDVEGGALTLLESCLQRNTTGLLVRNNGTATVHTSVFQNNTSFGLNNTTGAAVDARLNWWGSPGGPAPAGAGDRISANVSATPFLTNPSAAQPCGGNG